MLLFNTIRTCPFYTGILHLLAHGFRYINTFSMIPIFTQITANHKTIVMRLFANTPESKKDLNEKNLIKRFIISKSLPIGIIFRVPTFI